MFFLRWRWRGRRKTEFLTWGSLGDWSASLSPTLSWSTCVEKLNPNQCWCSCTDSICHQRRTGLLCSCLLLIAIACMELPKSWWVFGTQSQAMRKLKQTLFAIIRVPWPVTCSRKIFLCWRRGSKGFGGSDTRSCTASWTICWSMDFGSGMLPALGSWVSAVSIVEPSDPDNTVK